MLNRFGREILGVTSHGQIGLRNSLTLDSNSPQSATSIVSTLSLHRADSITASAPSCRIDLAALKAPSLGQKEPSTWRL